jgi:hypothetical protein
MSNGRAFAPAAELLSAVRRIARATDVRRVIEIGLRVGGIVLLGLYVGARVESKIFNLYQDHEL